MIFQVCNPTNVGDLILSGENSLSLDTQPIPLTVSGCVNLSGTLEVNVSSDVDFIELFRTSCLNGNFTSIISRAPDGLLICLLFYCLLSSENPQVCKRCGG